MKLLPMKPQPPVTSIEIMALPESRRWQILSSDNTCLPHRSSRKRRRLRKNVQGEAKKTCERRDDLMEYDTIAFRAVCYGHYSRRDYHVSRRELTSGSTGEGF